MKIKEKVSKPFEKLSFYNGEVSVEYDSDKHVYYLVEGEVLRPVPSVTTIVKIIDKSQMLINWAVKLTVERLLSSISFPIEENEFVKKVLAAKTAHRERLDDAGNVGSQAHNWIENYIKGVLYPELIGAINFPEDERAKNCCLAALDWMKIHNVRWVCTERKIYSRIYEYAGTLDGIAIVDSCQNKKCCPNPFKDRLSLIDWKTSNQIYPEYVLQTAAYQQPYQEETGDNIEDRWIIRLGKEDGEFEALHLEDFFEKDFLVFKSCLDLTNGMKSVINRMNTWKNERKNGKSIQKNN